MADFFGLILFPAKARLWHAADQWSQAAADQWSTVSRFNCPKICKPGQSGVMMRQPQASPQTAPAAAPQK
ncbi:MAG: hypothetical protein R2874_16300 [Desulfobacterales bacterium]